MVKPTASGVRNPRSHHRVSASAGDRRVRQHRHAHRVVARRLGRLSQQASQSIQSQSSSTGTHTFDRYPDVDRQPGVHGSGADRDRYYSEPDWPAIEPADAATGQTSNQNSGEAQTSRLRQRDKARPVSRTRQVRSPPRRGKLVDGENPSQAQTRARRRVRRRAPVQARNNA